MIALNLMNCHVLDALVRTVPCGVSSKRAMAETFVFPSMRKTLFWPCLLLTLVTWDSDFAGVLRYVYFSLMAGNSMIMSGKNRGAQYRSSKSVPTCR